MLRSKIQWHSVQALRFWYVLAKPAASWTNLPRLPVCFRPCVPLKLKIRTKNVGLWRFGVAVMALGASCLTTLESTINEVTLHVGSGYWDG